MNLIFEHVREHLPMQCDLELHCKAFHLHMLSPCISKTEAWTPII